MEKEFRIFPAGTHRGDDYSIAVLEKIASKHNALVNGGYEAPLAYGHEDKHGKDEAAGWVKRLSVKDGYLTALIEPTMKLVGEVQNKLFRNLSAEFKPESNGELSFRRLSVLGSMPPYHKQIDALAFDDAKDKRVIYGCDDALNFDEAPPTGKGEIMLPKDTMTAIDEVVKTEEGKGWFRKLLAGFATEKKVEAMDDTDKKKFDDLEKDRDALKAQLETLKAEKAKAETTANAAAFADARIAEKKATPADRDALIEIFTDLGEDKAKKYADKLQGVPANLDKSVTEAGDGKADEATRKFMDDPDVKKDIPTWAARRKISFADAEREYISTYQECVSNR